MNSKNYLFHVSVGDTCYPYRYRKGTATSHKPIHGSATYAIQNGKGKKPEIYRVKLNSKHEKLDYSNLKEISRTDQISACKAFLNSRVIIENEKAWCEMMLLGLLARMADKLVEDGIYPMPSIYLGAVPAIPETIELLLSLLGGAEEWDGKDWFVFQRHVLGPRVPRGCYGISNDPLDYNCAVVFHKKAEVRQSIPYYCRAFAMAPGVPHNVQAKLVEMSPLAFPIRSQKAPNKNDSFNIALDGGAFNMVDFQALEHLLTFSDEIIALVEGFIHSMRKKKKTCKRWQSGWEEFCTPPKKERYQMVLPGREMLLFAKGLSLFRCFLEYLSKQELLKDEEARGYLEHFWSMVLPETAPKSQHTISERRIDDPKQFLDFLLRYLEVNKKSIKRPEQEWQEDFIGSVQKIANGNDDWYFITPRDTLFSEFLEDVKSANGDCSFVEKLEKQWQTKLQRKFCKVHPFIKADKRDGTWKYDFYSRGKVPCIAIPIASLPQIAKILNLSLDELGIPSSILEWDEGEVRSA